MAINSVQTFDITSPQRKPKLIMLKATGTTGVQEETGITCVADIAGSLAGTYFDYNTPENSYRFWMDEGGAAPAAGGKTLVAVPVTADDADTVVAASLQAEMDGLSDITATVLGAVVTATNVTDGPVTDAVDGAVPTGFTIAVNTEGVTSAVALTYGQYDATIAETGAGPGDYTITLNEPLMQVPQVIVQTTTARAARVVSATVNTIRIATKNLSGTLIDSDFSVMILGSLATDLID